MENQTWIVTGANRGIGYFFVEKLLEKNNTVIATCRSPNSADQLNILKEEYNESLIIEKCDVSKDESVDELYQKLEGSKTKLNGIINNAGIYTKNNDSHLQGIADLDIESVVNHLNVNTVGSFRIVNRLMSLLDYENEDLLPKIITMGSKMGSIELSQENSSYAYKISKATLHMLNKIISVELKNKAICVVLTPGYCRTDMGGENAHTDPVESVNHMVELITNFTIKDSGKFYTRMGETVPW
eukprot:TRINITY_DN243_c0_g1_i4.p1 TRINITY_DN243_c0_g1~~TRINITY_DN243_c0_g1_i4.p1  ORF type:complete len:258 (+),score=57.14 TRINITY_DN243_c0_g1_i4:50-775(+)